MPPAMADQGFVVDKAYEVGVVKEAMPTARIAGTGHFLSRKRALTGRPSRISLVSPHFSYLQRPALLFHSAGCKEAGEKRIGEYG
jgi:hypothetical protein